MRNILFAGSLASETRGMTVLATLFAELERRDRLTDEKGAEPADGDGFPFPLTQADLADATGMTAAHVNRMLRRVRER